MLYIFLQGMVGSQTSTQMDLVVAAVVVPWIAVTRLECHNRTSGWRPWDADGFVFCVCPTQKKISPASSAWIPTFNCCQVDPRSLQTVLLSKFVVFQSIRTSVRFSWSQTLISVWKLGMHWHDFELHDVFPFIDSRVSIPKMDICKSEDERKLGILCWRRGARRHYLPWTEWLDP